MSRFALRVALDVGDLALTVLFILLDHFGPGDRDRIGELRSDQLGSSLAVVAESSHLGVACSDHLVGLDFECSQSGADGRDFMFVQLWLVLMFTLGGGARCPRGPEPFEEFAESEHEAGILLSL